MSVPPSPALTNPDMILPYPPNYGTSSSRPSSFTRPSSPPASAGDTNTKPPDDSPPLGQPMPGGWRYDEEAHNGAQADGTIDQRNGAKEVQYPAPQVAPAAAVPSPSHVGMSKMPGRPAAPLLAKLNPKLRANLAAMAASVDKSEYSPSVYSPTESELANKSPISNRGDPIGALTPVARAFPSPALADTSVASTSVLEDSKGPLGAGGGPETTGQPKSPEQAGDTRDAHDKVPADSPRSGLDEDESDPFSHTALSLRAEEILANAKKRLTV